MRAERPDPLLSVVCAAAARAHTDANSMMSEHVAALHRGQVPPEDSLKARWSHFKDLHLLT